MRIYSIHVRCIWNRASHDNIETLLLANCDEDVYNWVDKEKEYGRYTDKNNEDGLYDIYNGDYDVVGKETFKERMLRVGGEFFDADYEASDLYYGCLTYGWEELDINISDTEIETLRKFGVLTIA